MRTRTIEGCIIGGLATGALGWACSSTSNTGSSLPSDAGTSTTPDVGQPSVPDGGPAATSDAGSDAGLQQINHVVVVLLENWSFDSLYAEFPGADGLANALKAPPQVNPTTGQPYSTLPETEAHLLNADLDGGGGLPNSPFALDPFLPVTADTSIDLTTGGRKCLAFAAGKREARHHIKLVHW